jgi:uncharacterized protein YgbK (DUF1537 family)
LHLQCLLIADDLTGACDAAVPFASRGLQVRVALAGPEEADVLAFSTESRDAGLASFGAALEPWRGLRTSIIFKKIDSTLRGNVGPEVVAAMAAFGCDMALVTPAFPAAGRVVVNGYLQVVEDIGFVPRELAACFHGIDVPIALRDALCDDDLDAIVAEGLKRSERILWAGSAGLAGALARSLDPATPPTLSFSRAAPIFCLGSNHAVTLEQQARLLHQRAASLCAADTAPALPQDIVVLRLRRGHTPAARVRELLEDARRPLVLCGGDTASLVCRALDVRAIDLRREIAPGIPCGLLVGGPFDGLPVVTKSGGFGSPDALIEVADFFTCSQPLP